MNALPESCRNTSLVQQLRSILNHNSNVAFLANIFLDTEGFCSRYLYACH